MKHNAKRHHATPTARRARKTTGKPSQPSERGRRDPRASGVVSTSNLQRTENLLPRVVKASPLELQVLLMAKEIAVSHQDLRRAAVILELYEQLT